MPERYSPADRTFSYRPFKATVRTLSKYILPAVILLNLLANVVHCARLQIENAASPVASVFMLPAKTESVPERMEVPTQLLPVQAGDTDKDALEPRACCTTHRLLPYPLSPEYPCTQAKYRATHVSRYRSHAASPASEATKQALRPYQTDV